MKYDDVFKLYNAKVHLIIIIIGIILGVFSSIALNTPLQINIEEQYYLYDEESLELIQDYYTDFYNESIIISTIVFPILFSSIINSIYFLVLLKKQNKATIIFAILFILFILLSCFMIIPLLIYDIYQIITHNKANNEKILNIFFKISIVILIIVFIVNLIITIISFFRKPPKIMLKEDLNVCVNETVTNTSFVSEIQNGKITSEEKSVDTSTLGKRLILLNIKDNYGKDIEYYYTINIVKCK